MLFFRVRRIPQRWYLVVAPTKRSNPSRIEILNILGVSAADATNAIAKYGDIDTLIAQALLGEVTPQRVARAATERWRELAKWDDEFA